MTRKRTDPNDQPIDQPATERLPHAPSAPKTLSIESLDAVNGGWAQFIPPIVTALGRAGMNPSGTAGFLNSVNEYGRGAWDAIGNHFNPQPGHGAPGDAYVPSSMNPDGSINPAHFVAPPPPAANPNVPQVPQSGFEPPTVPGSYDVNNPWRDNGTGTNAGYGPGTGSGDYAGYDNYAAAPGTTNGGYGPGSGSGDYAGYDNYQNPNANAGGDPNAGGYTDGTNPYAGAGVTGGADTGSAGVGTTGVDPNADPYAGATGADPGAAGVDTTGGDPNAAGYTDGTNPYAGATGGDPNAGGYTDGTNPYADPSVGTDAGYGAGSRSADYASYENYDTGSYGSDY